jgi:hypothetical protein
VEYTTRFGSLADHQKGTVEIIDDDVKHYVFSNMFEVAASSRPWEKVAVAKNMEYVLEVIRAEGTSEWRTCAHDEFALVMDGTVEVRLVKLDTPAVAADHKGSVRLGGDPAGARMGRIVAGQGHMALLPANSAYQLHADAPSVVLLQTIAGDDTIERWSEICLS